jgi:hypothetical protein
MLYELTVGFHPFAAEGTPPEQALAAQRACRLTFPEYVERPLERILRRALSPTLAERYTTAGHFAGELLHYTLDSGEAATGRRVEEWLGRMLGLVT